VVLATLANTVWVDQEFTGSARATIAARFPTGEKRDRLVVVGVHHDETEGDWIASPVSVENGGVVLRIMVLVS